MWATLGLDLWECLTLRLNVFNRHKNTLIFQFLSLRLWEVVIFLKSVDHFLHIILQFMSFSLSVICVFSIFLRESFMDLLILISFFFKAPAFFLRLPSPLDACIVNLCSAFIILCIILFIILPFSFVLTSFWGSCSLWFAYALLFLSLI